MFKIIKEHKNLSVLAAAILLIIILLPFASARPIYDAKELSYGVTFSSRFVEDMGLNWQEAYLAMLDDLGVKKVRLPAYWDQIEYKQGLYNFDDLDWQIQQASERNVEIILAVGGRLPRWPECHFPNWIENTDEIPETEILSYLKKTVNRYKSNFNITNWQVENEPFLTHFGNCPKIEPSFLDKEIALVRELDDRKIIITDSGELSTWTRAMQRADIFGTTMYRDVYSSALKRYIHYPLTPGFFRLKYNLTNFMAMPKAPEAIVIELQAEPWGPKPYYSLTKDERSRTMNLEKFSDILEFSRQTGFKEFYLWGVEWWYWEREVQGNDALWEEAKKLF